MYLEETVMDFSGHEREPGTKFLGIGAVILLHVLIVYALVTGLASKVVEVVRQPVEAKIIEEVKPPVLKDTPPPPKPKLAAPPPPPFIPPPEVRVQTPPPPKAIANVTTVKPQTPVIPPPQPAAPAPVASPQPVAKAAPVRTAAVVDAAHCQKPEYPRRSERLGEEGTVQLALLIGVDGRVAQAKVEKSSGFKDLDNAALTALSLCKFKPATVDGKPEEAWAKLAYIWQIP